MRSRILPQKMGKEKGREEKGEGEMVSENVSE
jgi:hypothetical protein